MWILSDGNPFRFPTWQVTEQSISDLRLQWDLTAQARVTVQVQVENGNFVPVQLREASLRLFFLTGNISEVHPTRRRGEEPGDDASESLTAIPFGIARTGNTSLFWGSNLLEVCVGEGLTPDVPPSQRTELPAHPNVGGSGGGRAGSSRARCLVQGAGAG